MKCPGQDMQYWNTDAIFEVDCPKCKKSVEFYKDDPSRRCQHCGHRFVNPKMDFGCAAYCPFAEQCVGTLPEEFSGARESLLKDKVAVEVKKRLGTNFKQIGFITRVARYTEQLAADTDFALGVLLCAAYLNNSFDELSVDNTEASQVNVARGILTHLQADQTMIERVCSLIGQDEDNPSQESQLLTEARILARLDAALKEQSANLEPLTGEASEVITSNAGKDILVKLLPR